MSGHDEGTNMTEVDERACQAIAHAAVRQWGAIQKPAELASMLATVAHLTDPRIIIEIGSDAGGTLYAWRAAFPDARVFAVTLPDGDYAARPLMSTHGATVLNGNSRDPLSRAMFGAWVQYHHGYVAPNIADVALIDGDHRREGVTADIALWGAMLRPGGLLILHDVTPHTHADIQVADVWNELAEDDWPERWTIEDGTGNWGGIGIARKATEEHHWTDDDLDAKRRASTADHPASGPSTG